MKTPRQYILRSVAPCRDLGANNLVGVVPASVWADLGQLEDVILSDNLLSGTMPPSLAQISALLRM